MSASSDVAASLVEDLVAENKRGIGIVIEWSATKIARHEIPRLCRTGVAEQWTWRPQGPDPVVQLAHTNETVSGV